MSKKNIIRPQYEEFWDDCLKLSPKKNPKFNEALINNNKAISYDVKKYNNNNKIIFREKNTRVKSNNNHRLIRKILTTEESITKSIEKRKQKQINILTKIYNNNLLKKKKIQNKAIKLKQNIISQEKKNCTFKPKYYTKHRSVSEKYFKENNNNKKKIYERSQEYKDKLYIKLKEIKEETHKESNEEYPFHPEINRNNIRRILYGNNLWEELANNLSNEIFLRRYKKARQEENEKKKKLFWNFYYINESMDNEGNNNKIKNKKIHKSISQKNSLIYKQTLHNYLLEYTTNDEDNSDEDKKINNNNLGNNKDIKIFKN